MFFCIGAFKQNKQGVAVNREKMALLTKIGRHCLTFSGSPRALPASENIPTKFGPSLAQTRHTSILGSGPEGVTGPKNGVTDWILSDGTPGDAAIPTLLGVTQKLTAFLYYFVNFMSKVFSRKKKFTEKIDLNFITRRVVKSMQTKY